MSKKKFTSGKLISAILKTILPKEFGIANHFSLFEAVFMMKLLNQKINGHSLAENPGLLIYRCQKFDKTVGLNHHKPLFKYQAVSFSCLKVIDKTLFL